MSQALRNGLQEFVTEVKHINGWTLVEAEVLPYPTFAWTGCEGDVRVSVKGSGVFCSFRRKGSRTSRGFEGKMATAFKIMTNYTPEQVQAVRDFQSELKEVLVDEVTGLGDKTVGDTVTRFRSFEDFKENSHKVEYDVDYRYKSQAEEDVNRVIANWSGATGSERSPIPDAVKPDESDIKEAGELVDVATKMNKAMKYKGSSIVSEMQDEFIEDVSLDLDVEEDDDDDEEEQTLPEDYEDIDYGEKEVFSGLPDYVVEMMNEDMNERRRKSLGC